MVKDVKVSSFQLGFLLMGFLFGSTAIINPASAARQDAWLAYLLGWAGGLLLIGMYGYLSLLNPAKTLVEIIKDNFGQVIGSVVAAFYIWYFIHLAALVLRNFGEFMITVAYPETPIFFIMLCLVLIIAYAVRNGLEVVARASELFVAPLPVLLLLVWVSLISVYDFNNLFPFLENGAAPVLRASFSVLTFPFGETVVFLMLFPVLNKRENTIKVVYVSFGIMGFMLLGNILRDIMALGPELLVRSVFPGYVVARLMPSLDIESLIAIKLFIGGGVKLSVCFYAAVMGIAQLLNLDDYKSFVLPMSAIIVALSIWVYDNIFEMFYWASEIWPYYSIPFQIVIPFLLVLISWSKTKNRKH